MKVTITEEEYSECRDFANYRSEDSKRRNLKHKRNGNSEYLERIQIQSVIAEMAVAKLFGLPLNKQTGAFHLPDLILPIQGKLLPVDVKWTKNNVWAIDPNLKSAPAIICVNGWVEEEGGNMNVVGLFPVSEMKTLMLYDFGYEDRPEAGVCTKDNLIPIERITMFWSRVG